jgi:hypothetical protein
MSLATQTEFLRLDGHLRPLVKQAIAFHSQLPTINLMQTHRQPTMESDLALVREKSAELLAGLTGVILKIEQADELLVGQKIEPAGLTLLEFIHEFCGELSMALSVDLTALRADRLSFARDRRDEQVIADRVRRTAGGVRGIIGHWEHSQGHRLFGLWGYEFYMLGNYYFPSDLYENPAEWISSRAEHFKDESRRRFREDQHRWWKQLADQGLSHEQIARKHNANQQGTNRRLITKAAVTKALSRLAQSEERGDI